MKILILGLGNEFFGDDGIGICAVRALAPEIKSQVDIVESSLHGVALIDLLAGYDRVIIVDAIQTGSHPAGTLIELDASELRPVSCPSPHYAGLPEMIQIARELDLEFPVRIKILAVEINTPFTFGSVISSAILSTVKKINERVVDQLMAWDRESPISACSRYLKQSCSAKENDYANGHF